MEFSAAALNRPERSRKIRIASAGALQAKDARFGWATPLGGSLWTIWNVCQWLRRVSRPVVDLGIASMPPIKQVSGTLGMSAAGSLLFAIWTIAPFKPYSRVCRACPSKPASGSPSRPSVI